MKTLASLLFISCCFAAEIKDGKITELNREKLLRINAQIQLVDMQYKEGRANLVQQLNTAVHEACAGVPEDAISRCRIDTDKMSFHVDDPPKAPEPAKK